METLEISNVALAEGQGWNSSKYLGVGEGGNYLKHTAGLHLVMSQVGKGGGDRLHEGQVKFDM